MMNARLIDRGLNVHLEIDDVHNNLQHGIDNGAAARTAGNEIRFSILQNDRRRHRAQHAFAGCDQIRRRADQPFGVRHTGIHVEVVHFVVQQKARAGRDHT